MQYSRSFSGINYSSLNNSNSNTNNSTLSFFDKGNKYIVNIAAGRFNNNNKRHQINLDFDQDKLNKLSGFERTMQSIKLRFKSIKFLFIAIICITLLSLIYLRRPSNSGEIIISGASVVYSIIIDAGSTGSRIHVFRLNHLKTRPVNNELDVKLIKEDLFVKVKPGLSSYAKEPEKAADSVRPLLDRALEIIPKDYHKLTRVSLKATAGLRLISDRLAEIILNNVKNLFKRYPFTFNAQEDVSILDGKYEGIYSWLTLNYAISGSIQSKTCSLDLGGGSTQVTFVPTDQITLFTTSKDDLVDFRLDENKLKIFSKSYLGFGLMSARMNIFKFDVLKMIKGRTNSSENELFSVCLPPQHSSTWVQQGIEYKVIGPESKLHHSFEKCSFNVVKTIENKFSAPAELRNKEIYAFSFYFDRLTSAKIFENSSGGAISLKDILEKTISICDHPDAEDNKNIDKTDKDYPFLCMDLTFIYTILTVGYGLPNDKIINVHNEVNKMEISWALGAAFHMLND